MFFKGGKQRLCIENLPMVSYSAFFQRLKGRRTRTSGPGELHAQWEEEKNTVIP